MWGLCWFLKQTSSPQSLQCQIESCIGTRVCERGWRSCTASGAPSEQASWAQEQLALMWVPVPRQRPEEGASVNLDFTARDPQPQQCGGPHTTLSPAAPGTATGSPLVLPLSPASRCTGVPSFLASKCSRGVTQPVSVSRDWYMNGNYLVILVSVTIILPLALMKQLGKLPRAWAHPSSRMRRKYPPGNWPRDDVLCGKWGAQSCHSG